MRSCVSTGRMLTAALVFVVNGDDGQAQYQGATTSQPFHSAGPRMIGRSVPPPASIRSWPCRRSALLPNPLDARHPQHVALGENAAGPAADRLQLDLLGGLADQFLRQDLAVAGLDDDAVAAPNLGFRRQNDHVPRPVRRGERVA